MCRVIAASRLEREIIVHQEALHGVPPCLFSNHGHADIGVYACYLISFVFSQSGSSLISPCPSLQAWKSGIRDTHIPKRILVKENLLRMVGSMQGVRLMMHVDTPVYSVIFSKLYPQGVH